MAFEECPHCITKVIFSDTGICPACGKKKYVLPGKSRDLLFKEKEKEEFERKFNYYKKHGPKVMYGGILLILATVALITITIINGMFIKHLFLGILAGLGIVAKGYAEIREAEELKFFYDRKHNSKPNS